MQERACMKTSTSEKAVKQNYQTDAEPDGDAWCNDQDLILERNGFHLFAKKTEVFAIVNTGMVG